MEIEDQAAEQAAPEPDSVAQAHESIRELFDAIELLAETRLRGADRQQEPASAAPEPQEAPVAHPLAPTGPVRAEAATRQAWDAYKRSLQPEVEQPRSGAESSYKIRMERKAARTGARPSPSTANRDEAQRVMDLPLSDAWQAVFGQK
jgi:plasmid stabilization system protein ParE